MLLSNNTFISGNIGMCNSYAKINYTLDVIGKRADGYHEIETIMQTVGLFDTITVQRTSNRRIRITSNVSYLPRNSKNICYKAAELFFEATGVRGGADIDIRKNIPVSAGLAGGSGNGGAVLCILNKLFGEPFSGAELLKLGEKLGADVPFCMIGGTAVCTGVGECVRPISGIKNAVILLVKPAVAVSTPFIYKELDKYEIQSHPDIKAASDAVKRGDLTAISENLVNVMEPVTERLYPIIGGIKNKMLKNGALGTLMSGSGPTVFGIFDDEKAAKKSADSFYFQFKDVYLCKTVSAD